MQPHLVAEVCAEEALNSEACFLERTRWSNKARCHNGVHEAEPREAKLHIKPLRGDSLVSLVSYTRRPVNMNEVAHHKLHVAKGALSGLFD